MKTLTRLVLSLALLAPAAYAGQSGNGGFSYACGDAVSLVDLKEVEVLPYLKETIQIKDDQRPFQVQIAEKIAILKGIDPDIATRVQEIVSSIEGRFKFLDFDTIKEHDWELNNDLGFSPDIPGCRLIPTILYSDQDGVFVNQTAYPKLSERDKAALLLHEALYKIGRDTNHLEDSLAIRRTVAMLFAANLDSIKGLLKESIEVHVESRIRNVPTKLRLDLCFNSIYVNESSSRTPLKTFLDRTKITIFEGYPRRNKQEFRGTNFTLVNQRCDGGDGISYRASSKEYTIEDRTEFLFQNTVAARPLGSDCHMMRGVMTCWSSLNVNAELVLTVAYPDTGAKKVLHSDKIKSEHDRIIDNYEEIEFDGQSYLRFSPYTKQLPISEALRKILLGRDD